MVEIAIAVMDMQILGMDQVDMGILAMGQVGTVIQDQVVMAILIAILDQLDTVVVVMEDQAVGTQTTQALNDFFRINLQIQ